MLYSSALNGRRSFYVCLPDDYDTSDRHYPVIYMLHGRSGAETDWIYKGGIVETANRLIQQNQLKDCIIVTPNDGGFDRGTFYMDWYDGSGRFEQYIIYDLVPFIDANYRTVASREARVVGGLSMGGFGSFMLAMNHPDVFVAAASMSGVLGSLDQFEPRESARMVGPVKGPYARRYDLDHLAETLEAQATKPSLYFNCGTNDFLYQLNLKYKRHLESIGYAFEYNEFPGEHTWDYWKAHVDEVLKFFNKLMSDSE